MSRFVMLIFGGLSYLVASAALAYYIAWLGNFPVPKTIDSGPAADLVPALAVNAGLIALFLVPHSIMARPRFKAFWAQLAPRAIDRAVYVLHSGLALALMMAFWQPQPALIWQTGQPLATTLLWGGYALGWIFMLGGSFSIDHLELMGLKQVTYSFLGREMPAQPFSVRWFYAVVRHPIALGHLLVVWCTPAMSLGHAYYAGLATAYVFYATYGLEEPDLEQAFGETYAAYKARVPGLIPLGKFLSAKGDRTDR